MIVIDAGFAIEASLTSEALHRLRNRDAVAPALMWSEGISILHEMQWRGAISRQLADEARQRLLAAPIRLRRPATHLVRAWEISDLVSWAKTYDAEYVALAQLLACPLLTTDAKLARAAGRVIKVLTPADL
jgi:predicted nucleic acid-binding protein